MDPAARQEGEDSGPGVVTVAGLSVHITGMTRNSIQLLLSNLARPADRGEEQHHVRWFIDHGIRAEFECLHPPVARPGICDRVNFEAEGADGLIELHESENSPLRDGIIRSWWADTNLGPDLFWAYADPHPERTAIPDAVLPGPAPAAQARERPGLFGKMEMPPRRQLHHVRWDIVNGVASAALTCLHPPVGPDQICDKEPFKDDALLPFTHKGGMTELRDGVIESWWEISGWNEYDLLWKYADAPAA